MASAPSAVFPQQQRLAGESDLEKAFRRERRFRDVRDTIVGDIQLVSNVRA
jgi:hypothetical protein